MISLKINMCARMAKGSSSSSESFINMVSFAEYMLPSKRIVSAVLCD